MDGKDTCCSSQGLLVVVVVSALGVNLVYGSA